MENRQRIVVMTQSGFVCTLRWVPIAMIVDAPAPGEHTMNNPTRLKRRELSQTLRSQVRNRVDQSEGVNDLCQKPGVDELARYGVFD